MTGRGDVDLHYRADPDLGLVTRWQRLRNVGSRTIMVTDLPSFRIRCPGGAHRLDSLHGSEDDECRFQSSRLPVATTILESRSGKTGFEHAPWFALAHDRGTTFGQLAYSGNRWMLRGHLHDVRQLELADQVRQGRARRRHDHGWCEPVGVPPPPGSGPERGRSGGGAR